MAMQQRSAIPAAGQCGARPTQRPLRLHSRRIRCISNTESPCEHNAYDSPPINRRSLLQAVSMPLIPLMLGVPQAWADDQGLVFLDVKVEGKDLGRITIKLFDDVSIGAARFRDLAVGKQGVGYRLKRVDGIFETYIRTEGVANLSYSADRESPITGGDDLGPIEAELAAQTRRHDAPGLVSLVVVGEDRKIQEKLIARDGKLVTITQEVGSLPPNATQLIITRGAEPELDKTNLIVGQVVAGQDVIERVAAQPFAKPREGYWDKPFYSVAKAMGDKRATTAEKGFNRPLRRVIIASSGLVSETAA